MTPQALGMALQRIGAALADHEWAAAHYVITRAKKAAVGDAGDDGKPTEPIDWTVAELIHQYEDSALSRLLNCLEDMGIYSVRDLLRTPDEALLECEQFSEKSLAKAKAVLRSVGLEKLT